jgi:hypothetical protein
MSGVLTTFLLVAAVLVASGIRIANEHERFAVFRLGRYLGVRGPGLLYRVANIERWVRLAIGDHGELIDASMAKINDAVLPVRVDGCASVGQPVRVVAFQAQEILVAPTETIGRGVKCEKCGHVNRV